MKWDPSHLTIDCVRFVFFFHWFLCFCVSIGQYSKSNALLFFRNPFVLRDDEWKENRADISPAFTTMKVFTYCWWFVCVPIQFHNAHCVDKLYFYWIKIKWVHIRFGSAVRLFRFHFFVSAFLQTKFTYPIVEQMCNRLTKFIKAELKRNEPMMDTKEVIAVAIVDTLFLLRRISFFFRCFCFDFFCYHLS